MPYNELQDMRVIALPEFLALRDVATLKGEK
jgi:hypothetical protein